MHLYHASAWTVRRAALTAARVVIARQEEGHRRGRPPVEDDEGAWRGQRVLMAKRLQPSAPSGCAVCLPKRSSCFAVALQRGSLAQPLPCEAAAALCQPFACSYGSNDGAR